MKNLRKLKIISTVMDYQSVSKNIFHDFHPKKQRKVKLDIKIGVKVLMRKYTWKN